MKKLLLIALLSTFVSAEEINSESFLSSLEYAQVEQVNAKQKNDASWCFAVQVRHHDESWEHYANVWQVIDLKGNVLGERALAHPHDNEQPFTRSLCNIKIPENISKVIVRAKCNQHGFGGKEIVVDLTQPKGEGGSVTR